MEYGILPGNFYTPRRLSGYLDGFVSNAQTMHDPSTWIPTLNILHGQRQYLEELLSKTATTLNALRDRQTRNERALSTNPTPRSKRKKIQQNRWRTSKTIQTCENEERVILNCLQVCMSNIHTLEGFIYLVDLSSTTAAYYSNESYADSDTASFDWHGWTDDAPVPPFLRNRERSLPTDEIPPEALLETVLGDKKTPEAPRLSSLPPRSHFAPAAALLPVPPNTACTQSLDSPLSPQADEFTPNVKHNAASSRLAKELDKLSISGLLASKHMQLIQQRRVSDVATNPLFHRLSSNARPAFARAHTYQNWTAPTSRGEQELGAAAGNLTKRHST